MGNSTGAVQSYIDLPAGKQVHPDKSRLLDNRTQRRKDFISNNYICRLRPHTLQTETLDDPACRSRIATAEL
jgi:hypothetical protein